MSTLVQNYKRALESTGTIEDEDGLLYFTYLDEDNVLQKQPLVVADKPLVLPHKENLVASRLEDVVIFHPLSESVIRGESEVLQRLRVLFGVRFKTVVSTLAGWMVDQAIDPKAAKRFSPKQKAFFDILADATTNTATALRKIIEAGFGGDPSYSMLSVYLRRTGATYEGQKVTRAAVVSFPFMEAKETKNKKQVWCGVEVSQKDMRMLTALFEYLIPGCEDPREAYNAGSNDTQAPYFDCLIHSFAKLMENLNYIIDLLGDKFEAGKHLRTDLSWVQEFEPLSQYRGQIPPMPYNDGQQLNKTPEPTTPTAQKVVNNGVSGVATKLDQSATTEPAKSTAGDSPLARLMNSVKEQEVNNRWSDNTTAPQATTTSSTGGGAFNSLMEEVYKKNGMPIPQGGFGASQNNAWGQQERPQSASAIRRRQADKAASINQAWTGMRSSNW